MRFLFCTLLILGLASTTWAQEPPTLAQCQSQLGITESMAKEYYDKRDAAEREKITYKVAYERSTARLKQVMAEVETLKKQLEEATKPEEPKE